MVFTVGSKMYHPNKYNNHFIATTAATIIFTLAIMAASNMATPAAATTTTSNYYYYYNIFIWYRIVAETNLPRTHKRRKRDSDKPDPCTVNCGWKWNADLAK